MIFNFLNNCKGQIQRNKFAKILIPLLLCRSTHVDNYLIRIGTHNSYQITGFLSDLKSKTIWLSNTASQALVSLCKQGANSDQAPNKVLLECTPVTLAKAVKNKVEIEGFIKCHVRDAAALCCYFAWLEKEIPSG